MGILDDFDDQALLDRTDPTETSLGIAEWIAGRRVTLTWGAPLEPGDDHREDCLRRDEDCSCRVTVLSDGTVTSCRLDANDQMQLTMHNSDHDPYAESLHVVGFPWQEIFAIEILERRELKRHLLGAAMEATGWVNHVAILHFR